MYRRVGLVKGRLEIGAVVVLGLRGMACPFTLSGLSEAMMILL